PTAVDIPADIILQDIDVRTAIDGNTRSIEVIGGITPSNRDVAASVPDPYTVVVITADVTPPDRSFAHRAVDDTVIEICNCLVQIAVDTRRVGDLNAISLGVLVRPVDIDSDLM